MMRLILVFVGSFFLMACGVDNTIKGSYGTDPKIEDGDGRNDGGPDHGGEDPGDSVERDLAFKILEPSEEEALDPKSFSSVKIMASEPEDIYSVEFYINDGLRCEVFELPFECQWRVPAVEPKEYEVSVYINSIDGETYYKSMTVLAEDL